MSGGLLQLLAKGAQDNILTGNPQISHFKIVFRRHTNFSMETIKQEIKGNDISQNNNNLLSCKIKRDGDLLTNVYFNFELPEIYSGADAEGVPYEFKWVENIGTNIFSQARLIIGNTEIDKHDSNFFNVYSELTHSDTEKQIYNKLIGNVPELYNPSINEKMLIPVLDNDRNITVTYGDNQNNIYSAYSMPINSQTVLQLTTLSETQVTLSATESDNGVDNYFTDCYIKFGYEVNGLINERINPINQTDPTTFTLDDNATSTSSYYVGCDIEIAGERRTITTQNGLSITVVAFTSDPNIVQGTPYKILPACRKITNYISETKVVTFDALSTPLIAFQTNIATPYNIYRSNGTGMKVAIKKNSSNKISFIDIINPGFGHKDGERMYIDINSRGDHFDNGGDPSFFIKYSDYPHCRHVNTTSRRQYNEITDNIRSTVTKNTDLSSVKSQLIPSIPKRKMKVPMNFFFNKERGMALPMIALQYNEVSIEVTLRTIADLFTISELTKTQVGNTTNYNFNRKKTTDSIIGDFISLNDFTINHFMEATFIFLDTEERSRFASSNHDYLIQEVQTVNIKNVSIGKLHDMNFYHPVKELIVIGQRTDLLEVNQWNNYTNWSNENVAPYSYSFNKYSNGLIHQKNSTTTEVFYNKAISTKTTDVTRNFDMPYFRKNIIDKMELQFNGSVREREKDHQYFNYIHPYEYFKTNPKDGIHAYSFSAHPNEFQPSGACNFSRISNFQMNIELGLLEGTHQLPKENNNIMYDYNYTIYAVNYNILKIASGMASKQFAN